MAVERNEFSLYAVKLVPAGNVVRFPQVEDHTAGSARGLPSYVVRDTRDPDAVIETGRSRLQGGAASPVGLGAVVRRLIGQLPRPAPSANDTSRPLPETAALHGITWPEIKRISDGFHHMRKVARDNGGTVYRVDCATGADTEYFHERLVTIQREEGVPQLWLRVEETKPEGHFHYIIVVNNGVLARCRRSSKFNELTAGGGRVFCFKRIRDDGGWRYLTKEATSQAAFKNPIVWKPRRGSHRLPGDDIADRVIVSAELAKHVEPWKRRYRRHKAENTYPADRRRPCLTTTAPVLADQLPLFDDPRMKRPVNRLDEFGGGLVPPVVALDIEHHRRRRRMTQVELARRCRISQGQLSNALRGHDPLSAWATRRLHDILLARVA